MADVFISYAREDRAFVQRLHEALAAAGRDPWVDWEGIPASARWMAEVRAAIDQAECFCFVISPDSVESSVCREEAAHAAASNKRILPLLHRHVPDELVPETVAAHSWIAFDDQPRFDAAFAELVRALETDQEHLRTHTRLLVRAKEWEASGDRSSLLRGSDLTSAEAWLSGARGKQPAPTRLHAAYVLASRKAASLRQRITVGAISLALVVSLVLSVVALIQRSEAIDQRDAAERASRLATARELGSAAIRALESDTDLATLLALESIETIAEDAVVVADAELALRLQPALSIEGLGDGGSLEASLTPDLSRVAVVAEAGPTAVWELAAGQPGRRVFTVPTEVQDPAECRASPGWPPCDAVLHAALSPDGAILATGHGDRLVRIWNVDARQSLRVIRSYADLPPAGSDFPSDLAPGVGFSPDGRYLWTQARYGSLIVWDLATAAEVIRAPDELEIGQVQWPHGKVAFSDDGRFVAFGGLRNQIWDMETHELLLDDPEFSFSWPPISFSRDGVASDGYFMWDLDGGGREPLPNTPLSKALSKAADLGFSPDGTRLAIVTTTTVLVWDVDSREPVTLAFGELTSAMAWSPDSSSLATGGTDGTVEIWDVDLGRVAVTIPTGPVEVTRLAFTPDGERLAIAADDGTVSLHIVQLANLIEFARDRPSRNFTEEECLQYLIDPCPA